MTRRHLLVTGTIVTTLLLLIAAEWVSGLARLTHIVSPMLSPVYSSDRLPLVGETAAEPDEVDQWLRAALARPLMASNRRPAVTSGDASTALVSGLPRLSGTLSDAAGGVAIFARDEGGHAAIVRQGGALGPYRVTRVVPNGVTLDGPGGIQIVHPRFGTRAVGQSDLPPPIPGPMNMPGVMPGMVGFQPPFGLQQTPPTPQ